MATIVERRCSFESCRQVLKPDWRFCPNCGTDQEPDTTPPDLETCIHTMDLIGPFCTRCGYDSEAFMGMQRDKRHRTGVLAFVSSAILFMLSGIMLTFFSQKPGVKVFYVGLVFASVLLVLGAKLITPRRSERTRAGR